MAGQSDLLRKVNKAITADYSAFFEVSIQQLVGMRKNASALVFKALLHVSHGSWNVRITCLTLHTSYPQSYFNYDNLMLHITAGKKLIQQNIESSSVWLDKQKNDATVMFFCLLYIPYLCFMTLGKNIVLPKPSDLDVQNSI